MAKVDDIVRLYNQGYTTREIANKLGVGYQRVYMTLIAKGLHKPEERDTTPKMFRKTIKRVGGKAWSSRISPTSGEEFTRRGSGVRLGKRCKYAKEEGICKFGDCCELQINLDGKLACSKLV